MFLFDDTKGLMLVLARFEMAANAHTYIDSLPGFAY